MSIDEAIRSLQDAKASGVKNLILAWWGADMFGMTDNEQWAESAELVESKMDWSNTHDQMSMIMDNEDEDEDEE